MGVVELKKFKQYHMYLIHEEPPYGVQNFGILIIMEPQHEISQDASVRKPVPPVQPKVSWQPSSLRKKMVKCRQDKSMGNVSSGVNRLAISMRLKDETVQERTMAPGNTTTGTIGEGVKVEETNCKLQPIVIDGGCLCTLIRYRITIPVDFQKTELYDKVVGFSHCYCHACRNAVSALTRTRLKVPRDMVQWTSRGKVVEQQNPECPASPKTSVSEDTSTIEVKSPSEATQAPSSTNTPKQRKPTARYQYQKGAGSAHSRAPKLRTALEAIEQETTWENEAIGTDTAIGCCCDDEDEQPPTPVVHGTQEPNPTKSPWSGKGYHKRIWKRGRGVGGKDSGSAEASPRSTASSVVAPDACIDGEASPGGTPLTHVSEIETSHKGLSDSKEKAKAGLWNKMKDKASGMMSSKDRQKGKAPIASPILLPASQPRNTTSASEQKTSQAALLPETPAATATNDVTCPATSIFPPPSSLEILRWETKLDQQCPNSDSDSDSDCSDPCRKILRIPWPFKEYSLRTRDGRTSYNGFCAYCGGSISYRTSVTIHDMVDLLVGSMDDPAQAMKEVGFLAEYHCDLAGSIEDGARLKTQAGNTRDEKVVRVMGCDWEPIGSGELTAGNRGEGVSGFGEEFVDEEMVYDEAI
ncbi:hypothetical protein Dda_8182 [Drechslerella dactyloides]|uniref:Uncharacterized protein n=1 Tax=Drechslerella dactyloides TaxID=74499 RepID=A0AAD6IRS7_DREDA|nr:hypothetical protein Dda_8182 [Drechslerella dactyloides]